MNNFGLGLILNFTDNASAGMNNAAKTLSNLSATADKVSISINGSADNLYDIARSMQDVGNTMTSVGSSILGVFTGLGQKVIDTGMTMQGFRMQMKALYGDTEGEQKIKEIQEYAQTSVFEVEGLISSVAMMKAVGIEAMDDITTSSGKNTQKLMDYASDLAAMMPNMRNVYGTGVQAALGAFKEYIAEGNALSLKRGAGLDITQILGEDKGASIEERTQQVADLIEQLNIVGYTASLAGTPMQQLSNISDVFFNVLSAIADSGAFDTFCNLLSTAAGFIQSFTADEERFAAITSVLGDVISTLMRPLQKVLDFVVANADAFFEWMEANPFLAKTLMLLVAALGALPIGGGQLFKLSGTVLMFATSIKYLGGTKSVLAVIGTGFKFLFAQVLPLIAIAGVLYLTWKNNLFGIRDVVTSIFGEIGTVFSLVKDAWGDNTLSYENFKKAEQLGILPFIEALLDLRYHWDFFTEGFSKGFKKVFEYLDKFLGKLDPVTGTVFTITESIGKFLKQFMDVDDGSTKKWEEMGEVFGTIAGAVVLAVGTIVGAMKAFSLISGIVSLVASPFGQVLLIIGAVVAAVMLLKYAWDNNLGGIQDKVKLVFEKLLTFYNTYLVPLWGHLKEFFTTVGTLAMTLWNEWLKPAFDQIWGFLQRLWTETLSPLLEKIGSFVGSVVELIFAIINAALWLWNNVLSPIVNWLVATLAPIVQEIIAKVVGIFEWLFKTIGDIVSGIITFFTGIIDFFVGVFTGDWSKMWEGIKGIFQGIWDTFSAIVKGVVNAVIMIVNNLIASLYSVLATVVNGIAGIINGIASFLGFDIDLGIPSTPPQIPYLAEGGLVQDPTAAVVGEGKDDEAVLPLNDDVFRRLADGINSQQTPVYQNTPQTPEVKNEYNISFAPGSVVVKCENTTESELEKTADRLLKIIQRKLELKKMAKRNTGVRKPVFA